MATDKPRISVTLDEELSDRIDYYQYKNKISTKSKAIAELVRFALDMIDEDSPRMDMNFNKEIDDLMSILQEMKNKKGT